MPILPDACTPPADPPYLSGMTTALHLLSEKPMSAGWNFAMSLTINREK